MKTAIMAAAVFGLLGLQAAGLGTTNSLMTSSASAAELNRYESGESIQRMTVPQRAQVQAQAEGNQGGNFRYGRGYAAAEQTGVDGGSFRTSAAEQSGVDNGAFRTSAAEQTGVDGGSFRTSAAEQTGVDGGSFRTSAAEQTGVDGGSFRTSAAEQTGVDGGSFRTSAAEQTGVDNGRVG